MAVAGDLENEAGLSINLTDIIRTVLESLLKSVVLFEVMSDQEQCDLKDVLALFKNYWQFVFPIIKSASLITDEHNIKDMLKFK